MDTQQPPSPKAPRPSSWREKLTTGVTLILLIGSVCGLWGGGGWLRAWSPFVLIGASLFPVGFLFVLLDRELHSLAGIVFALGINLIVLGVMLAWIERFVPWV